MENKVFDFCKELNDLIIKHGYNEPRIDIQEYYWGHRVQIDCQSKSTAEKSKNRCNSLNDQINDMEGE